MKSRYSDFRFSETASDDNLLCIAAYDAVFSGDVIAVQVPLDGPSEHDAGMELVNKIVKALNQ